MFPTDCDTGNFTAQVNTDSQVFKVLKCEKSCEHKLLLFHNGSYSPEKQQVVCETLTHFRLTNLRLTVTIQLTGGVKIQQISSVLQFNTQCPNLATIFIS